MTDEEKEAIEFFEKSFKKKIPPYWYDDTISNIEEKIKVILNLIEKQSKEIEELKEIYQTGYVNGCVSKVYEINKKWKDKIKAKIEEVKDGTFDAKIVLQSLLEKE